MFETEPVTNRLEERERERKARDIRIAEERSAYKRRHRRRRIMIRVALLVGSLSILFGIFCLVFANTGEDHDDGYSIGTLINVRMEGMLFARPAATLLHSGEMKGDEFAMDLGLYQAAMVAADKRIRVKVGYSERYVCWTWNYASCRIITSIKPDPGETK